MQARSRPLFAAGVAVLLVGCGSHPEEIAKAPEPTPPPTEKRSAFDSNSWNSAIGLSGGTGARFGGRLANTESYAAVAESGFFATAAERLSTFAADVDTASYANVRRMLAAGERPPADAVRVEEFVNAMDYDNPEPSGNEPFAIAGEP